MTNPVALALRSAWWLGLREPWQGKQLAQRVALAFIVALILAQALRESWAQGLGLLASIFSLVQLVGHRAELRHRPEARILGPVALGFVVYFALHAVRLERAADLHALDGPSRFLLLAPLLYLPWIAGVRWSQLSGYLALSGMAFGLSALVGVLHSPEANGARVFGWFTYFNLYGYASTALLGLLVVGAHEHRSRVAWALGIAGCVSASVLSGTRGAWLALPVLLILGARQAMRARHRRLELGLAAGVAVLAVVLAWPTLTGRLNVASNDVSRAAVDASGALDTSVGYRLAMWRISFGMIEDKPWTGQGLSAFPEQMQRWADRLGLQVSFPGGGFKNPHNQYLGWAAVHGVPVALLMLGLVFVLPCVQSRREGSQASHAAALWAFVGMTAVFCLTESVLERQRGAAWFVIWIGLLLGSLACRQAVAQPVHGASSVQGG